MSNYNVKTTARTAIPRSKRLREGGAVFSGSNGGSNMGIYLSPHFQAVLNCLGVDENNDLYVKMKVDANGEYIARNFYSYGNVSSGGIGSGGGGGGGLASVWFNGVRADDDGVAKFGIKVNGVWATVLTDAENGKYVDITAATGTVKWGDIQEKPSWIGNTKPSYSQLEVINFLGYTPADNASLGNYLPLTGGTMTGELIIKDNNYPSISFKRGNNIPAYITYLGNTDWRVTDEGWTDSYKLYHTGNFVAGTDYVSPSAISDMATKTWVGQQGFALASSLSNYLPLTGGYISGNTEIDEKAKFWLSAEIGKAYLSIHPEKADKNILPFFTNDIAFLLKRGGYAESYYTTATDYTPATIAKQGTPITDLTSCFDGSAEYCYYNIDNLTSKVVIDLTLHTIHRYQNVVYIDFGQSWWGARKITVLAGKDNGTYTEVGQIDSTVDFSYYKCNVDVGDTGVNKIRIVLTNYNTTTPRIAQIGFLNFASLLGRETFMSRGMDDELFRNLVPQTSTYNLGETNKPWGKIYANKWFPKPGDESVYIEYDTTNNCFKVHGTIVATGNVIAGS